MHDDPEKNPPAGEDVFEERAFIISDDGSTTPVTWNHRVLMIEQDGEKSDFKSRKKGKSRRSRSRYCRSKTSMRSGDAAAIVGVRGLLSAAEKVNEVASSSLCCDHCRGKLRFRVHR